MTNSSFPENSGLDPDKLVALRYVNGIWKAQCPQCHVEGRDNKREHLAIFDNGKYHCIIECDTKAIYAIVGKESDWQPNPAEKRRWHRERTKRRRLEAKQREHAKAAREYRSRLIELHPWPEEEILADSPVDLDQPTVMQAPERALLTALFPPDAVIWTGGVEESGSRHAARWQTVWELSQSDHRIGPMTTPSTWKLGCVNRSRDNVATSPYTVLDFDGFDGVPPSTPDEIRTHRLASAAIIRWLREKMDWQPAAIVFTGSKSLHAWFHSPPPEALKGLHDIAPQLGIDPGLIGQPEHPCRLPGHPHKKTGNISRLLWLQAPEAMTP